MKGIIKKFAIPLSLLLSAPIAFALGTGGTLSSPGAVANSTVDNKSLGDLLANLSTTILAPLVTALLTLALLAFFWGMIKYIKSQGTDKKEGKDIMIWGIIGLAVMVSVWGLVNLVVGTLGVNQNSTITVPQIPGTAR